MQLSLPVRIVIIVCTYRRPQNLPHLIGELQRQASAARVSVRIIVVDNDAEMSAYGPLRPLKQVIGYVCEPSKGIGWARNRGLDSVESGEAVIFFDDDQMPGPGWLSALEAFVAAHPEAIGVGPVTPRFETSPPEWGAGWAWGEGRADFPDGGLRRTAGFGNVVIPAGLVADHRFRVDGVFLNGPGEDTMLSVTARGLGWAIRHVADATATETVVTSRLTTSWVINRFFADGRTWGRIARRGGVVVKTRAVMSAGKSILKGIAAALSPRTDSMARRWARLRAGVALATGILTGLCEPRPATLEG